MLQTARFWLTPKTNVSKKWCNKFIFNYNNYVSYEQPLSMSQNICNDSYYKKFLAIHK